MAAPPLLGLLHLGQNQPGLDGIENPFIEHPRHRRRRTADMQIEVTHAGPELIGHAPHTGTAARGKHFNLDAEAFAKMLFQLLTQLSAGRDRNRDLTFFATGIDDAFPVRSGRRLGCLAQRRRRAGAQQCQQ